MAVDRMAKLNAERRATGQTEIGYGIGLHIGNVMFGNVGLIDRMTFSVFGAAANEVQWQAFKMPEDEVAEGRALLQQSWRQSPIIMHAAWLDREIVSAGTCASTPHGLLLYGGATVSRARGRGAYRALLRARWDEAMALGTPALITQGGSMSRPILERLGFEPVGHVHMLLDEFGKREA